VLTKLKNGVHIRLADVRSIKVEQLSKAHGWESEWGVKIAHGDQFGGTDSETCVFDSDHAAHKYSDEIAGQASQEMKEEADRTIERDTRREKDRLLDRICVLASGVISAHPGNPWTIQSALDNAIDFVELIDGARIP
jgi:hypothetical protein